MRTILTIVEMAAAAVAIAAQGVPPQAAVPAVPPQVFTTTMSATIVHEYSDIKDLLTKTADKMPAEAYSFQPTPETRTFAGNMGHILASDISQCGTLLGRKHALSGQDLSKTLTTKADVVKAAADTFAFCDEYCLTLNETTQLADTYANMNGRRNGQPIVNKLSSGSSVVHFLAHNNEEYGYLAVYMRLKGIVPPSSAPGTPGPGGGLAAGGGR